MGRFLFTTWPFPGHVHPHLSVAGALRSRGHEVAFYTGTGVSGLVEGEGFEIFPFRNVDEVPIWKHIQELEATAPIDRTPLPLVRTVFREWLAGTVRGQAADVKRIVGEWRPDVIVTDPMMWGPILLTRESLNIPVAVLAFLIGCPLPGRETPPWGLGLPSPRGFRARWLTRAANALSELAAVPLRRELDRVRAEHGLPAMGCSVNAYSARLPLYLLPSISELDFQRQDLPPSVRYVGPCTWNKPSREPTPTWLDELPGDRPLIHATEGTAHHQDPFVLKAVARGLAGRAVEVVLTTGGRAEPSARDLSTLASNIRVESWVSHDDLLPRCAAFVTTGGAGSVLASLRHGVPMVIVPTRWDKPDNAQRVVEAGAGLRIAPKRCRPQAIREAVERVLAEPSFAENARRLSRLMADAGGPPLAASLLETLLRSSAHRAAPVETSI
ncbi:MAG: glycosyltransferase [Isosphaeraceae bacterium]